ncbi:MAG: hypothetical protein ICCCNLDF_01179 [Planctomycetes bacterium]|nr:hypothetical protein [Planctomycetota bacterium]
MAKATAVIHEGPRRTTKRKPAFAALGGASRLRFVWVALLMLIFASSFVAQDAAYKPPRKWTFGSMGVAMRDDLTVYQGGAKDADGNIAIKEHDRLLKWNGTELKNLDDFCRNLYATKPGEIVEVEISRPIKDKDERQTLTVKIKLGDPKQAFKELYTQLDKRQRGYDWRKNEAVTKGGPLREKLWPMVDKHKLQGEWDNLIAAHERELDLWDSYENLSSTDLLLSDPLSAHQWIELVGNQFSAVGSDQLNELSNPLSNLLDRKSSDGTTTQPNLPDKPADKTANSLWWQKRADAILALLSVASQSDEPWEHQWAGVQNFEFHWRGEEGFPNCASRVDGMRESGIDASAALHSVPIALDELRKLAQLFWDAHTDGEELPLLSKEDTQRYVSGDAVCFKLGFGVMAIGGREANRWSGKTDTALEPLKIIVDLGGDDEYVDCGVTRVAAPVQVVIDLGGKDHYRSTGKWGVACGVLGTAIIDDHEGNDTYECPDWGIGAAFGGIGLLIDRKGNDRYLGGNNSIGCAAYGVGGVIDLEGNDLYDSHTLSVGVGQPGGVGFVLDHSGDDHYRCTGGEPSPYGTKGEWFGGGIGCGFGWRTLACGGIGLVVDVKGNDIYDAGEFGLGCGYFMAIGAVRDMDGDDIYHASRYGLAAAAHAAVGLFMDDKGNDVYEGKTAASIGGTWDIVTGYFYDGGGDDNYRCDGLGLGACAQNGFGIFWDAGGADNYRSGSGDFQHGGRTIGKAGNAEYGGGRLAKNFGIFMDTGGGKDNYPRDNRKNGSESLEDQYGLFLDE